MNLFSDPHIFFATTADSEAIINLLNSAYRGESSKKGWTSEVHLIAGERRTDEQNITEIMNRPGSVFLKHANEKQQINGCVNLQHRGQELYLGMFGVSPLWQGGGIGKQLLKAAEEYALHLHCDCIYMSVVSVRTELINWYERHGYKDTGERVLFEEDELTGKHLQPLEFMTMKKNI